MRSSRLTMIIAAAGLLTALATAPAATAAARPAGPPRRPVTVTAGPAEAALSALPLHRSHLPIARLQPRDLPDGIKQYIYQNWAGYGVRANSNVQLRYVTAEFTLPTVSCPANGDVVSFWAGLDGWAEGSTVEQTGVDAVCMPDGPFGLQPTYYGWYDMSPEKPLALSVLSAGDFVQASVYYDSGKNDYQLALDDHSDSSGSFSTTQSCPPTFTCHNTTAEAITEDPGGPAEGNFLPPFATAAFQGVGFTSRDGTRGVIQGNGLWNPVEATMVYPGTTVMAQPSGLSGGSTQFSVTYKSKG